MPAPIIMNRNALLREFTNSTKCNADSKPQGTKHPQILNLPAAQFETLVLRLANVAHQNHGKPLNHFSLKVTAGPLPHSTRLVGEWSLTSAPG